MVTHLDFSRGKLAQILRDLAGQVDAGEIDAAAITFVTSDGSVTTAFGEAQESSTFALIGAVGHLHHRLLSKVQDG